MDALITFLRARLDEDQKVYGSLLRIMDLAGDLDPDGDSRVMCTKILADVAAKRQIIALHVPANPDDEPREGDPGWPDKPWLYCKTCGSGEPHEYPTDWPCATINLIARPFVGHPDYREDWKP